MQQSTDVSDEDIMVTAILLELPGLISQSHSLHCTWGSKGKRSTSQSKLVAALKQSPPQHQSSPPPSKLVGSTYATAGPLEKALTSTPATLFPSHPVILMRNLFLLLSESPMSIIFERTKQIDPTGVEDSFLGGFVCGLVHGLVAPDAALVGNLFGSLTVGQNDKFDLRFLQVESNRLASIHRHTESFWKDFDFVEELKVEDASISLESD
ncbi:hypothetical protein V6N13_093098 [Hibiscus sabdariffa]|uniref:Uncharacterized protein n=2 Tax=Hibiscus sabdariffa TaxID=183260 RepID=A0ABR2ATY0_9ROSI